MHPSVEQLLEALQPEPIGPRRYRAHHTTPPGSHLFGGQVMAQCLACTHAEQDAQVEIHGSSHAHSLHAHFLRRGNTDEPIEIDVEPLRQSRAFATWRATARQADGAILEMTASYHAEQAGPAHQIPMDDVGPPTGEAYEAALLRVMTPSSVDTETELKSEFELPVEIRGVGGVGLFNKEVGPPQARCWLRMREALPDDGQLHQILFAYASDYAIMVPTLNPHPLTVNDLDTASLDHAIWFHRRFRTDEWLLLELDSPVAASGRGIGRGLLYTAEGELVASCIQECLLRIPPADG